jgi:hypothetical protein
MYDDPAASCVEKKIAVSGTDLLVKNIIAGCHHVEKDCPAAAACMADMHEGHGRILYAENYEFIRKV